MRRVLVDTGALVALVRSRDKYHLPVTVFRCIRIGRGAVIELARASRWLLPDAAAGLHRTDRDFEIYRTRSNDRLELVLQL